MGKSSPLSPEYGAINSEENDAWEIAASGGTRVHDDIFQTDRVYERIVDPEEAFRQEKAAHEAKKLGQFRATAIAGNDITCA